MPCYRCGTRQVDPVRGPSLWKRGVRAGSQVLVCPDCQHGPEWLAELDHCAYCGSEQLARILGETLCRACGKQGSSAGSTTGVRGSDGAVELPEQRSESGSSGLSTEVADALDRIFHRK
jgi:hypothetical protein